MATSDDLIKSVGANIQEKASLIWSVADTLRGPYKPHEYGLVILPMTVIKRFHDCLLSTHQKVLDTAQRVKTLDVKDGFLRNASGYPFYNTSKFTFETLKADPDNIEDNFKDYINGFSDNVQDILARMKFADQIERLSDPDAPPCSTRSSATSASRRRTWRPTRSAPWTWATSSRTSSSASPSPTTRTRARTSRAATSCTS